GPSFFEYRKPLQDRLPSGLRLCFFAVLPVEPRELRRERRKFAFFFADRERRVHEAESDEHGDKRRDPHRKRNREPPSGGRYEKRIFPDRSGRNRLERNEDRFG